MTNTDVVRFVEQGYSTDAIVQRIKAARSVEFRISPEHTSQLEKLGVSKEIIDAMIRRASASESTQTTNQPIHVAPPTHGAPTGQILGNWTIPTMTLTPGSEGSSQITDIVETAIDPYSGLEMNVPTTARPAPYAQLTSPSGNRVVKVGEPITITLSNVKPNMQVWVAETAMSDPAAMGGSYVIGGYTGMTDNDGHYIWQTVVGNWLEGHAYTIWVGNWGGTATGPRPDSDIVATVAVWVTDASGNPAAPSGFAALSN